MVDLDPFGDKDTKIVEEVINREEIEETKEESMNAKKKYANARERREAEKGERKSKLTRAEILKQHGGLRSNIPINSPYWQMKD